MKLGLACLLLVFVATTVGGCAVASDDVDGVTPGKKKDGGSEVVDDDAGDDAGGDDASFDDTGSAIDTGSSGTDTGSSGTDTGSSGTDTGSSGTDTGSTSDTSGGGACTILGASDCTSSSQDLGSVSGDTGADVKTASGTDNKFLKVKVTENDSSLFSSKNLRVRVTLSSTAPDNYDLYLYLGKAAGDGGGVECTSVKDSSTSSTGDDVIEETWTDNHPIGGFDDTRWVTIEVRSANPKCSGATWSLTVEGNK